jgi:hypothetical protein
MGQFREEEEEVEIFNSLILFLKGKRQIDMCNTEIESQNFLLLC